MIKVLGTKRVMGLLILLAVNSLLAAGVYLYAVPEKAKKEKDLRRLRDEISMVVSDIDRLQIEFEQLEEQQEQFDSLRARGFFSNQDRRQAEIVIKDIQKEAGVISSIASVSPGVVEDSEEAQKSEHKILSSPVKVTISALDDIDVFRYIYLLEEYFPGHVTINKVQIERAAEISGTVLRGIASGASPELVKAEIELTWRTMIPMTEIIDAPVEPVEGEG